MKKLKILVLSSTPWNVANSFGNSYHAIFREVKDVEIANIYCQFGTPNDDLVKRAFQMTETSLIRSILYGEASGHEVAIYGGQKLTEGQQKGVNWIRRYRFRIFFWLRDAIWLSGKWKSKELLEFVTSFNPDVLWIPVYYSIYLNKIALFLKKYTGKKVIGYISDDNYTLKQFNLSPFYWIERLITRRYVKKTIINCKKLYVITDRQKKEYDAIFNLNSSVLAKGGNFSGDSPHNETGRQPYRIVFMGNLGDGRETALAEVKYAVNKYNKAAGRMVYQLSIHSMTPLSNKMCDFLEVGKFIPDDQVKDLLMNTDILLHVESRKLNQRMRYRLSLSTKIVTYLECGGFIIAYGGRTGTTEYIKQNDIGIFVENPNGLDELLHRIEQRPEIMQEYRNKAWLFGKNRHDIYKIGRMIRDDIEKVVQE